MMPMANQPDIQKQETQSGKLVLPAPPSEEQQTYHGGQQAQLRPGHLIRPQSQPVPKGVGARLVYYWRKDPAYKVLMVAMAAVLLAGIVFVSLASSAFQGNPNFFSSSSSQNPQAGVNPTGTVDLRPSFPTPGGGNGNATIPWYVFVFGFGQKNVQATVYAVATDQNGQQAKSQVETVQVQSNGGGG